MQTTLNYLKNHLISIGFVIGFCVSSCSKTEEPQIISQLNPQIFNDTIIRIDTSFKSDGHELAGTLVLPEGTGPYSLVIFVHGSGNTNRTNNGSYQPIMDSLVRHRFAYFSWDKPGVGESTGIFQNVQSFTERSNEVTNAISLLGNLKEIDRTKIGLWGISQAGWVMPKVYQQHPNLAFIIAISNSGQTPLRQSRFAFPNLLSEFGIPLSEVNSFMIFVDTLESLTNRSAPYSLYRKNAKEYTSKHPWAQNLKTITAMTSNEYSIVVNESWLNEDPAPLLDKLDCPLLAIWGENDNQIDLSKTIPIYAQKLAASKSDHRLITIQNTDHTISENGTYSTIYIPTIVNWLNERFNP